MNKFILFILLFYIIQINADCWYETADYVIKYQKEGCPEHPTITDWERKAYEAAENGITNYWYVEEFHFKPECCKSNIKFLDIVTDMTKGAYCENKPPCWQWYNKKIFYFPPQF